MAQLSRVFQALQQYRGLDYNSANCNIQELRKPLEPFNRDDNQVPLTKQYVHIFFSYNK
jgi:hypothetical protein